MSKLPTVKVTETPERAHITMAMFVVFTEVSMLLNVENLIMHMCLAITLFGKDIAEAVLFTEDEVKKLL